MVPLPAHANNFIIDNFEFDGGVGLMLCDIVLVNNIGATTPPPPPPVGGTGVPTTGLNAGFMGVTPFSDNMVRECSLFLNIVNPPSSQARIMIFDLANDNTAMFQHSADVFITTTVMLWWDDEVGAGRSLDLDLTNSVNLRITYSFTDRNVNGMATLFDGDGDSASVPFTLVSGTVTATEIYLPLNNFVTQNNLLNLNDIDEIKLTFVTPLAATDYAIDLIDINMQPAPNSDTIGLYRPSTNQFFLFDGFPGSLAHKFLKGAAGDIPLDSDWNGDGQDTFGLYRPSTNQFFLFDGYPGSLAHKFFKGAAGDIPLDGDWNGDGQDTFGLYRPSTNQFFLFDGFPGSLAHKFFKGAAGDIPLVGDWNGDGQDTVGLYRPSTNQFFLFDGFPGSLAHKFFKGAAGDLPLDSDWNGDGQDTVGLYRPSTNQFILFDGYPGSLAHKFFKGAVGDTPLAGDW